MQPDVPALDQLAGRSLLGFLGFRASAELTLGIDVAVRTWTVNTLF
jgi:hypothetical protein